VRRTQECVTQVDISDISYQLVDEVTMFYVLRDASGQISSLHRDPVVGAQTLPEDHPEVRQFMGVDSEHQQFATLDASFLRVLEDVIDALIRRNVLCITDLPMEAQLKLFDRKHFREGRQTHALDLYNPGGMRGMESNTVIAEWSELPE
jgi:hypothetical protein